jgi:multiple sugar transport system ATP-binding protein
MATVTFENVSKRYGDVVAVDDLNLDIRDAEFMVLVGPSGCGKTTSLRMIAGLEEITDGTLRIGERIINDVPPKDRDIAMVFQSYALYPHMTIRDNLAFGLKLRHIPKVQIEARVKEAAAILDLTRYLDRKPRELSGGQRQRVALGRAIVREPLSNLDAKLRVETRANILRLHQRLNTTFVYVTHDQIEAMTMGTRIAVMNEGRLQQVGTPQELYDRPINRFVAGFIGSPAMNFATVEFTGTGEAAALQGSSISAPLPPQFRESVGATGRQLIIGFRPEHLVLGPITGGSASVNAKAEVVEYLGNEELIHASGAGRDIVALIDSSYRVRPGDMLELRIPLDRVQLFDPDTNFALPFGPITA